jgi:peptidoglycan hydrolase-like protein with peptidoglycan-binding domain
MSRPIAADIIDSLKDDWLISDDGFNRLRDSTWPAPRLKPDDRTPYFPSKAKLTTTGSPDAYAFLRPKLKSGPSLGFEDFADEMDGPPLPQADAMGIVQYRTVPQYVPGLAAYEPGFDRYTAGMLLGREAGILLQRTDAGALDGFASYYHNAGFLDDAGLPASWYDVIGRQEQRIIDLFKSWSGGKFPKGSEDVVRRAFVDIRNSATSDTKWDFFNKGKNLTFKLLDEINAPIVSGGASPEQAIALMMGAFGKKAAGPKPVIQPIVRAAPSPDSGRRKAELTQIWRELEAHMNNQGGFIKAIGGALGSVGSGLASVGKGVVGVAKGIATPVAALVTSPARLASDIASGKNVFASLKDTVKRDLNSAKEIAPYAQAVLSVVPGVGSGVNAAIAAGSALAQGQPITSAIVSGLKNSLPGGPLAAQAFDTTYAIARGQNVGDAALQALVNNAPGGDIGRQAAQTAIAVAKGQNLQQAALGLVKGVAAEQLGKNLPDTAPILKSAVSDLAQGKNIVDTAKNAVGATAMATFNSRLSPLATGVMNNAGPRIADAVKGALPTILPTDVRMAAQAILNNPSYRSLPVEQLAQKLGVNTNVVRDAMGTVLQAAQKSGGPNVPSLSLAKNISSRIPVGMSFDNAVAQFASKAAPKVYSHNALRATSHAAAKLRQRGAMIYALTARGLDCGALDPTKMPTIRLGSTGDAVKEWQKIVGVTADGKFGPQTDAATRAWQTKNRLKADGIVGPATWTAALVQVVTTSAPIPGSTTPVSQPPPASTAPVIASTMPTIREGSTGAAVKTWQTFLGISVDGVFGPQTKAATIAFQTKNGLVADGIVGPQTWSKAMSGTAPPPNLPPVIPGTGPITTPPMNIPPVVVSTTPPPALPPVVGPVSPPNPPGQPPPPPPVVVSPPGTPPVVLPPPNTPPMGTGGKIGTFAIVAALGIGVLAMSGSRSKLV